MRAIIKIVFKKGVFDAQGSTIQKTLVNLGFECVEGVRQGKYIEVDLVGLSKKDAYFQVKSMCRTLLANPVIEDFTYELVHTGTLFARCRAAIFGIQAKD